jgi:hypothetical protein
MRWMLLGGVLWCSIAVSCAQVADPIFSTNAWHHFTNALHCMNMTPADMQFAKDVAEPRLTLPRVRSLLQDPAALPSMGDELLAVCATNSPPALWTLIGDWMDCSVDEPGAVKVDRRYRPWDVLDYDLAFLVSALVLKADKAAGLIRQAFSALKPEDRAWLAASLLMGVFNAEDDTHAYAAVHRLGIPTNVMEQVLQESHALVPEPVSTRFLDRVAAIDRRALYTAARLMQEAADTFVKAVQPVEDWPDTVRTFASRHGPVIIGTPGNDRYDTPAFLIVDPGGNDTYADGAAMVNGLSGVELGVVLDLAGDDHFTGHAVTGPGAALFGSMTLVDAAGDDRYDARYAGQAAGIFGTAWLEDRDGDDTWHAGALAQGAGYAGLGILMDRAGSDVFTAGKSAQGYAGLLGFGLLYDATGNDTYLAGGVEPDYERHPERFVSLAQGFAIGMRPFGGGGIAALVDGAGNDRYTADIYGQGVAYWYALGMLLDRAGCDEYSVYHYGQGSGIHLSAGLLFDGAGNDRYTGYILTQGNAHDYSVGMLFERAGHDTYTADHHSQGRSLNNGLAVLVDEQGHDAYFARQSDRCQGIGNDGGKREYGCMALLLDLQGRDQYTCGAEDGDMMLRPSYGMVYDWPDSVANADAKP